MNKFAVAASTVLMTGAVVIFASVKTDYDKAADFSKYHTYSYVTVKASNSLWTDRITRDIDEQLSAKGWQKSPSGGDASISAFGSSRNQQTLNTFYDGLGGGWGWRGFGMGGFGTATTTVENTPVGTLVVDVFDTPSKKLIWRGVSTETLSDKPAKNEDKLEKAVADMFKKFPPKDRG